MPRNGTCVWGAPDQGLFVRSTNEWKALISIEGDSREHISGSNVKKSSAT